MAGQQDSALFRAWAVPPFGANYVKTVCLTGQRARDPEAVGSKGDRDTETCQGWARAETRTER